MSGAYAVNSNLTQGAAVSSVRPGKKPAIVPPFQSPELVKSGKSEKIPYDAGEYWSKLMTLIKRHDGYIEAPELEDTFSAKMFRVSDAGDAGYTAFLVGKEKWFDSFLYMRFWKAYSLAGGRVMDAAGGDFSSLSMPGILDGRKQCLDPVKSVNDLKALGWTNTSDQNLLVRTSNSQPPPEDFGSSNQIRLTKAGRSIVNLVYVASDKTHPDQRCVVGVYIEGYR